MNRDMPTVREDRPLTTAERNLLRWLFEHSEHVTAPELGQQIDDLHVISRCDCGCASVDFSVGGREPATHGMRDVTDEFYWASNEGHIYAVLAYQKDDLLAGLEVYSVDGLSTPAHLPNPTDLRRAIWLLGR